MWQTRLITFSSSKEQILAHVQKSVFIIFQVEHKAGVLDITATKDKATVDVKSDTIRLVVKPGDRQMPVADIPETKVVNVAANEYPPPWQKKTKIHH